MNKELIFEKINWWFVVNMILNPLWICFFVLGTDFTIGISVVIIYSLLITIIIIYSRIYEEY